MRKYLVIILIILWAGVLIPRLNKNICPFAERTDVFYKDNRVLMGTFIEVVSPSQKASGIVFSQFQKIDNLLSKYKEESEVSRLNKTGELAVSPETFFMIKKSIEFYQKSQGAFDITVAPLVDLWGFTDKKYTVPAEEEIKNTLNIIGSDKIILNAQDNVVKFKIPGVKIDLGGIAKGYALDCAINKLKEAGIKSCLITAGGQVYALGDKKGKPWRVAIKSPRNNSDFTGYLELKDQSVSTSGDYEQYFIQDKKRYSHILDPRSGYSAESGIISVTVIASDGLTADALSTAIFVLGKEKGLALAKEFPKTEVRIYEQ